MELVGWCLNDVGGRDSKSRVSVPLRYSCRACRFPVHKSAGAIRLGPSGRRSTSVATASECVDGAECDTCSVARSSEYCTRSCRTAWSDHGSVERAQAPTRRMLVDQKGLGKPPVFSGREEDFHVWAKKVDVRGGVPSKGWKIS